MAAKKTAKDAEATPRTVEPEADELSRDAQWSTYDVVGRPPDDDQPEPLPGLLTEQTRGVPTETPPDPPPEEDEA